MRTTSTDERAAEDLVRWRREQMRRSGFPPAVAARLAEDTRYDLHALTELVECGCPPRLAVRILAPLDGDAAS